MSLLINDDNLDISEVQEFSTKIRALILADNQILIANYGNVLLLPGGSIDENETVIEALIRELQEEIGQQYTPEELTPLTTLDFFQKDYPKRDGTTQNRLVRTYYYIGKFKKISPFKQQLTEKETRDNFHLNFIPIDELEQLIQNNDNTNPRNKYFKQELLTILHFFTDTFGSYADSNIKVKKEEQIKI